VIAEKRGGRLGRKEKHLKQGVRRISRLRLLSRKLKGRSSRKNSNAGSGKGCEGFWEEKTEASSSGRSSSIRMRTQPDQGRTEGIPVEEREKLISEVRYAGVLILEPEKTNHGGGVLGRLPVVEKVGEKRKKKGKKRKEGGTTGLNIL